MPAPLVTFPDLQGLRRRSSAKWRQRADDVLPLDLAEMDVDLAHPVTEALAQAVARGDTGYPWPGTAFAEAVAGFAARRWSWDVDPARVSVVADVATGVVEVLRRACAPGAGVVISPPVYPPFREWVRDVGARLVQAPLRQNGDGGWRLDLDALEGAFRQGVAAYVLCNPHNPVGRVHSPAELGDVVQLAHRYGVLVVSDEIHAPLTLAGAGHTPLLTLPGAAEVAVSVVSASKAFNLAGLKCAAVVSGVGGPDTAGSLRELAWHAGHLGVLAGAVALTDGDAWLDELLATLGQRRDEVAGFLAAHLPGLTWDPPQATYLAWLDWRGTALQDPHAALLARGVALDPGQRFGAPGRGWMRLNFGTSREVLDLGLRRMAAALPAVPAGALPAARPT